MAVESWDDAMLWHGSLIGYMAGVKSACKDEDKSNLLLRMADTQARLEFMESENVKLREERDYYKALCEHATVTDCELRRVRTAWKEDRKQNDKLRQMVARMWRMATRAKRCTFADRLKLRAEIDELGIEVGE